MTTLTPPASSEDLALQLCIDCGTPMVGTFGPCTPARCQYEGVEHLLLVLFTDGDDVCGVNLWVSPSTHLEVIVDSAIDILDEIGLDVSEWELLRIHKLAVETREGFTACTPPVELA